MCDQSVWSSCLFVIAALFGAPESFKGSSGREASGESPSLLLTHALQALAHEVQHTATQAS